MSITVIERKAIEILEELQKIKQQSNCKSLSDKREIDRIKNIIAKKIAAGTISPDHISVEFIAYGCQLLETDAEEIYQYLKSVGLIPDGC